MIDIIVIIILVIVVGLAIRKIYLNNKNGIRCSGCSDSSSCANCTKHIDNAGGGTK